MIYTHYCSVLKTCVHYDISYSANNTMKNCMWKLDDMKIYIVSYFYHDSQHIASYYHILPITITYLMYSEFILGGGRGIYPSQKWLASLDV